MNNEILNKSMQMIEEADCVLIGAGAGLTAAAGINYTDKEKFAEYFPAWKKRGFDMQYQLMGYQGWTMAEMWGYYTVQLGYVYFEQKNNSLYQSLRNIIGSKPYFVMTSNVDELFRKSGFDADKIYTPQGNYNKIQCTVPCSDEVWDIQPFYEKMKKALDPVTQVLTDEAAIPKCPICGEDMFIHARIDGSFIDSEHDGERKNLTTWMDQHGSKKILLLELGAGYNTPMVIRYPMESLYKNLPNASFIRVNLDHAEIPNNSKEKSLSYEGDIVNWIQPIESGLVEDYSN